MRKIILILSIVLLSLVCNAQRIEDFFKKSALQTEVENAIKPGLFVIRQNFVLRKNSTGEYFTRNNAAEFSFTYSLAVKTADGYFITETAAEPWKYDEAFLNLKNSEIYTPVNFKTLISPLCENADYTKLDTGKIKTVIKNQKLFSITDTLAGKTAFEPCINKAEEYFTVWVTISDTTDLYKNTNARIAFYTASENEVLSGNFNVPASGDVKILGGIIMATDHSKLGVVKFCLVGIITPEGETWKAVMLPKPKKQAAEVGGTIELTPIKVENQNENPNPKNKKKKK